MFKKIFVLESSWDESEPLKNSSVMPFISEFAKQREIKAYHQVFTDTKSFEHWVKAFNKESNGDALLYIASHGNYGSLEALNSKIQRTTVIDRISKAKNIPYVHFGSCHFGNRITLNLLMKRSKHLKWAAGYMEEVDWMESTLFDLFIWSRISPNGRTEKNRKTHSIVEELMNIHLNSFAKEFQFRFLYRRGKSKVVENLIDE